MKREQAEAILFVWRCRDIELDHGQHLAMPPYARLWLNDTEYEFVANIRIEKHGDGEQLCIYTEAPEIDGFDIHALQHPYTYDIEG